MELRNVGREAEGVWAPEKAENQSKLSGLVAEALHRELRNSQAIQQRNNVYMKRWRMDEIATTQEAGTGKRRYGRCVRDLPQFVLITKGSHGMPEYFSIYDLRDHTRFRAE